MTYISKSQHSSCCVVPGLLNSRRRGKLDSLPQSFYVDRAMLMHGNISQNLAGYKRERLASSSDKILERVFQF